MCREGVRALLGVVLLTASLSVPAIAQRGTEGGEWPHYAGDSGSTKYSPLDQIDRNNFEELEIAWRWASVGALLEETTEIRPFHFRGTPLMIDGVVYMPTGMAQVAALDPATGEMLWRHDSRDYELDGRGRHSHRLEWTFHSIPKAGDPTTRAGRTIPGRRWAIPMSGG